LEIRAIGAKEIQKALEEILKNIKDAEIVTRPLANLMKDYVHVDSSYLKSTIYYDGPIAGASASYAGYEADRGGSHDFPALAMGAFNIEEYADTVVRPF
jgi:hypothetical protein